MNTINVLLVDEHRMFVEALALLLEAEPDIRILAPAFDGESALAMVREHSEAHVIIRDISMPEMDGIQVARKLRKSHPQLRVLAVTQNADGGSIARAVKAG